MWFDNNDVEVILQVTVEAIVRLTRNNELADGDEVPVSLTVEMNNQMIYVDEFPLIARDVYTDPIDNVVRQPKPRPSEQELLGFNNVIPTVNTQNPKPPSFWVASFVFDPTLAHLCTIFHLKFVVFFFFLPQPGGLGSRDFSISMRRIFSSAFQAVCGGG